MAALAGPVNRRVDHRRTQPVKSSECSSSSGGCDGCGGGGAPLRSAPVKRKRYGAVYGSIVVVKPVHALHPQTSNAQQISTKSTVFNLRRNFLNLRRDQNCGCCVETARLTTRTACACAVALKHGGESESASTTARLRVQQRKKRQQKRVGRTPLQPERALFEPPGGSACPCPCSMRAETSAAVLEPPDWPSFPRQR